MSATPLPTFKKPPVTEVVVSAQFDPLPGFLTSHFGLIWQRFRSSYPKLEEHPVLSSAFERLGTRSPMNTIQFQVSNQPGARAWFVNESGDQLVQVQNDRFIRNWRAMSKSSNPYPRWDEHVLPRFLAEFDLFREALNVEGLGAPNVNQLEVTYINHIWLNDFWKTHGDLHRLLRWWAGGTLDGLPVEAINLQAIHQIANKSGDFLGRLHVTMQSGVGRPQPGSAEEKGLFVLSLTARGKPDGEGDPGIRRYLDIGHAAIVSSFEKMTTDEAHNIWQKQLSATH